MTTDLIGHFVKGHMNNKILDDQKLPDFGNLQLVEPSWIDPWQAVSLIQFVSSRVELGNSEEGPKLVGLGSSP